MKFYLVKPFRRDELQYNRFHCSHVTKSNFRNIESTYDMRPSSLVCPLKGSIPTWA